MATYEIDTLAKLRDITPTHLGDDCVLLNDIDASETAEWNISGGVYQGFAPIGIFSGTFDGGGFTISGLYINRPTTDNVGLFGNVIGAGVSIANVNITGASINGRNYVGILAGYMRSDGGVIDTCTVQGTVTYSGGPGGGMAGYLYRGTSGTDIEVTDCSANVTITRSGTTYTSAGIGGLVGSSNYCNFTTCWSSGVVKTTDATHGGVWYMGGLVGMLSLGSITSCYSTAAVWNTADSNATFSMGGLIGLATSMSGENVATSYATGGILNTGACVCYAGGFVGQGGALYSQCMATGDVNNKTATSNNSGGFIGREGGGSCTNCLATGDICMSGVNDASAYIGGFAGYGASAYTLTYCYSIGAVYTTASNGGGLVGGGTSPTTTSCYWDTETSGWSTSLVGTGKTTAEMKTQATFTSWDFDTIWQIASFTMPAIAESGLKVWFSEIDDYENFEEGVEDADSFSLTIQTTNEVRWLDALGDLLVGTAADEWKIGSNKVDTPLTPTNWTVKQQSSYGSAAIQPVKVGDVILFVDFVGRKVRELTFDGGRDKYVAPDLTSLAEHITYSGIVCIAHQKNPDSILWCVLTDGSLVSMNYDRDQNVVAWAKHPIGGNGLVQSVCVTPGATEDEVFLTVGRTLEGDIVYWEDEIVTWEGETVTDYIGEVTYIEKMASRIFTDIEDCFFVDSGLTYSGVATNTLTAAHLVGETVSVFGTLDGVTTVYEDLVVAAGGVITLPDSATVTSASYGLPFTYKLQPMRIVMNTQNGTSMGSIADVGELVISFLNTGAAQYGVSDSDLKDINFDDERWVNNNSSEITGLFTGEVVVSMPGNLDPLSPIIISGDSPLPCTVRALVPRMEVTGR